MERAYLARDASYDGVFFLAVKTTGIFCRPSCPARKPKPANVCYFASPGAALADGFRPCKRCRPLHTNGTPPAWVRRLLDHVDADPARRLTDADLRTLAVEPTRARRYFKEHFGMTFQAYSRARRMNHAHAELQRGAAPSRVALDHGYESESGFREAFSQTLGAPPVDSRATAPIVTKTIESVIGPLRLGATPEAACLLEFTGQGRIEPQYDELRRRFNTPIVPGSNAVLDQLADELAAYFAGALREFTVPLAFPGTPFQERVWRGLLTIPYGQTLSYEELAERAGHPGAQRAVGSANGRNRIAIVIPCHRVINKSGKLGGYGGALWRKQALLDLEREIVART